MRCTLTDADMYFCIDAEGDVLVVNAALAQGEFMHVNEDWHCHSAVM